MKKRLFILLFASRQCFHFFVTLLDIFLLPHTHSCTFSSRSILCKTIQLEAEVKGIAKGRSIKEYYSLLSTHFAVCAETRKLN